MPEADEFLVDVLTLALRMKNRDAIAIMDLDILFGMRQQMSKKELLIHEIEQLPEPALEQILDFVHYLRFRMNKDSFESALLSESSLGKDWLREEEERAWQHL